MTDYMIARDVIVSFYIFRLLKYDRIFGKNLEHDTYGLKNKALELALYGGQYQIWSHKFMIVLFFHDTFK